jgi:hypothetical protein
MQTGRFVNYISAGTQVKAMPVTPGQPSRAFPLTWPAPQGPAGHTGQNVAYLAVPDSIERCTQHS